MFHRRRAASNPAHKQPPNPSALLAATKASSMRDHDDNASLSSAAAAAALRSHPTSPISVGSTITKRMARKGSTSSRGSGSPQLQHPGLGLRRHSSSGSMTERSFRSPSPNRGSPSLDHRNAPPVPPVPKVIPDPASVSKRASSLDSPYREGSPVGRGAARGAGLGRGASPTAGPGQAQAQEQAQAARVTSLAQDGTEGSPRSINFSRPMSPSPQAPTPVASPRKGHGGWHGGPYVNPDATFRGDIKPSLQASGDPSTLAAHNAQQAVQNASEKPVSKKRISSGVEGARLASGSMRARPSGTHVSDQQPREPVDPHSPFAVYDPSTRTFIHKQDAMQKFRELNDQEAAPSNEYVYQQHSFQPARNAQQQVGQRRVRKIDPSPIRHEVTRSPSPPPERAESPEHGYERPQSLVPESTRYNDDVKAETASPLLHDVPQLARRKSEDVAGEDVRPVNDANTSRKIGSAGPLRSEQHLQNPATAKLATNLESPYPRLSTPVNLTSIIPALEPGRATPRSERTQSLSPPRNAHFSAVTIELPNGVRHQPPPRSVSPAKSALKASPSVSRRNSSPLTNTDRIHLQSAPSEASDTMSEDGAKTKKKKAVRVSFDEEPVIAGTSAYVEPEAPSSPTGPSQSRWSPANGEQDIDDVVMRPRPVLPSFGSIRGNGRRSDVSDAPEKVTETVSSSMSASVGSIGEPLESSKDHAIGGILARDFASSKAAQDPLPPEVTSVEGTGYVSDSSSNDSDLERLITDHMNKRRAKEQSQRPVHDLEPKTLTTATEIKPKAVDVPVIAVQPASPSPRPDMLEPNFDPISAAVQEIPPEAKVERTSIPGGWGEDESDREDYGPNAKSNDVQSAAPLSAENLRSAAPQTADHESSDDNSSIYSDAHEEFTDAEDGGFASIDALIESPVISPSSGSMSKHADRSPMVPADSSLSSEPGKKDKTDEAAPPEQDWAAVRQHWSGLNDSRKQQALEESSVQRAMPLETPAAPVVQVPQSKQLQPSPKPKPHTQAISSTQNASSRPAAKATKATKTHATAPSAATASRPKPSPKKINPVFDEASRPAVHIRKSLRGSPDPATSPATHMRQSMRANESGSPRAQRGLAASRHSMPPPAKGTLQKKHSPAIPTPSPKVRPQSAMVKPTAPTYDSDSDASASSFQRSRPRAKRGADSRYTMRASMRGSAAPTMREAPAMRTMSPVEKAYSPTPTALRRSMRPSSPDPTPPSANKSSRFSIRSLSPAGRFRQTKTTPLDAPPIPTQRASPKQMSGLGGFGRAKTKPVGKSRPKSRFADSSDEEEEARPNRFQSRFADSDSEDNYELPPGLTPVRGIPRRAGDEENDSTDLEEELSDAEPAPVNVKDIEKGGLSTTNGNTNGNTNSKTASFTPESLRQSKHAPALPSFQSPKKTKRSFFGLGKKKTAKPQPTEPDPEPVTAIDESRHIPLPPEQHNRPLTPIGEDQTTESPSGSRSPRLQRRSMPPVARTASNSWPLPKHSPADNTETRPQSSDGISGHHVSRPTLIKSYSSQPPETPRTALDPKTGKEVILGHSGKKKKFQGLRRVFGLDD